jgi:hypothetical protein
MPARHACNGGHLEESLQHASSFHPGVFASWVKWPIALRTFVMDDPVFAQPVPHGVATHVQEPSGSDHVAFRLQERSREDRPLEGCELHP